MKENYVLNLHWYIYVQDLQLPEWQLVTMAIGIGDDEYDPNYFKIQLDILPKSTQDQYFKNATDVSELMYKYSYHKMLMLGIYVAGLRELLSYLRRWFIKIFSSRLIQKLNSYL